MNSTETEPCEPSWIRTALGAKQSAADQFATLHLSQVSIAPDISSIPGELIARSPGYCAQVAIYSGFVARSPSLHQWRQLSALQTGQREHTNNSPRRVPGRRNNLLGCRICDFVIDTRFAVAKSVGRN